MDHANQKVVTRFAPSPTGFMHVGGIRTALYAWLWAKKNNGTFILRIEDTDKVREVAGSMEHIIESLRWLGVNWDEGPDIGGPNAPYIQSERLETYKKYAQILIDRGHAYPDPYTQEELETFRKNAESEKRAFLYRDHRPENPGIWDGTQPLRLKTPQIKSYSWSDAARGDLSAGPEALDDFVLIKSDGYPTYNLAHIIDDLYMGVTHIMRSDEFISSTPKFLSLYEALDIEPPIFATLPPILAEGGKKKMGKRDGAKDILEYRAEGYLPDTMINFLALLGWNPGGDKEIFTREELIQAFTLERIQVSGAQMNLEKLDWMNKEHLARLTASEFESYVDQFMPEKYKANSSYTERLPRIAPVLKERLSKGADILIMDEAGEIEYFFDAPIVDPIKLVWKGLADDPEKSTKIKQYLTEVVKLLEQLNGEVTKESAKDAIFPYADANGRGEILWPTRVALSGRDKSPDPFTLIEVLGIPESINRLKSAIMAV